MHSFILTMALLGVVADPGSNPIFTETSPLNRGARAEAPSTPYNRLNAFMRLALQERARRIAADHRMLGDADRRKAMKSDLYWYANANFDGLTQPWRDAELAFLQNLVEDTARPYDAGRRPAVAATSAGDIPLPPDDFVVKRWHSGVVRGRSVMVWAVRDPNNPANLLVDRTEQMPEVRAVFDGGESPPAATVGMPRVPAPPPVMYTYAATSPMIQTPAMPTFSGGTTWGVPTRMGIFGGAGRMGAGGGCVGGSCGR